MQIQLTLAPANQSMILSDGSANYSEKFELSDIRLLADMVSLTGELQESYNAAMLSGSSLKIPVRNWECLTITYQRILAETSTLPLARTTRG